MSEARWELHHRRFAQSEHFEFAQKPESRQDYATGAIRFELDFYQQGIRTLRGLGARVDVQLASGDERRGLAYSYCGIVNLNGPNI